MADPIEAIFRKPFAEQVAAFRLRLGDLVPSSAWDDLLGNAHDRGFMVAGAVKADLLADLAAAVDRSITEGTGFEAFKGDFRAIVAKHGWTGWTGEDTEAGQAWRMRTIYHTNILDRPDSIEAAGTSRGGHPIVRFIRRFGSQVYTVSLEIRGKKRRMLAVQSMWGRNTPAGSPT